MAKRNRELEKVPSLHSICLEAWNDTLHPSVKWVNPPDPAKLLDVIRDKTRENRDRTKPCNTKGRTDFPRTTQFVGPYGSWWVGKGTSNVADVTLFTPVEKHAYLSNKLMGHTEFHLLKHGIRIKMNSFVQPEAWLEGTFTWNQLQHTDRDGIPIKGRLSNGLNRLVLRVIDSVLRIDDLNCPTVWAEIEWNPFIVNYMKEDSN